MKATFAALLVLAFATPSFAGKVDEVREMIKKECGKDLDKDATLNAVKRVYLTCIPGQSVEIESDCKVKCQKANEGAVIGG